MSNYYLDVPFGATTLVDLLYHRALQQPENRTYTFLIDGEVEGPHLTYGELDLRARAIAAILQQRVEPGSRAMLVYPADLEFIVAFFGCLYAGVIAVPTYPPQTRTKRSLAKLRSIMNDVQPSVVLTISSLSSMVESLFAQAQELQGIPLITTDDIANDLAGAWRNPDVDSSTLAFLQYTSGSTGMPKGVMLTHGNLLHNLTLSYRYFDVTPGDRGVTWLPPYHDMGLIGMILGTVYAGVDSTIMSPVAFLQRPIRWLQAISNTGATVSGGPNFAYDLCVRKITPEQKATLDLSTWRVAVNGAEPIRPETLDRFVEAFAPCGFRRETLYPCYGLAEASLIVTGGQRGALPAVKTFQAAPLAQNRVVAANAEASSENEGLRTLVGSGRAPDDQKVIIVDPESLIPCGPDQVGEIWVLGPSVAQGYWQKPTETEHTFRAYLANGAEGPFMRTGDLGFLQDGELFVTGRLKDLIIIRGRNHYPQDIELTVEQSHPALRTGCGVAFSVDVSGEERLVIVYEVERQYRNLNVDEVVETIRQAVAEHHELQVYAVVLIKMSSIPKTSSGKLQRRASREAFLAGNLEVVGEWTLEDSHVQIVLPEDADAPHAGARTETRTAQDIQAWLLSHIAEYLKIEPSKIDVREPLARYGMDSVQAVNLTENLSVWLGRELSPTLAYEYPTIEAFAGHLAAASNALAGEGAMQAATNGDTRDILGARDATETGDVAAAPKSNGRHIREKLLLAQPVERQRLLEDYIREKVAAALKLSPSRLDTEQPLSSLGLDSLMAMELKNWIEEELGVQVPITVFLQESGIAQFSAQLLDQLVMNASTPLIPLIPSQADAHVKVSNGDGLSRQTAEQLLANLDQLSDEEVDALLSRMSQEEDNQAEATNAGNGDGVDQQTAEQLLAQLDQLSDEEVDSLLSQMSQKESE